MPPFDPMTVLQVTITLAFMAAPIVLWVIQNRRRPAGQPQARKPRAADPDI